LWKPELPLGGNIAPSTIAGIVVHYPAVLNSRNPRLVALHSPRSRTSQSGQGALDGLEAFLNVASPCFLIVRDFYFLKSIYHKK
jgi:hypothetical protein